MMTSLDSRVVWHGALVGAAMFIVMAVVHVVYFEFIMQSRIDAVSDRLMVHEARGAHDRADMRLDTIEQAGVAIQTWIRTQDSTYAPLYGGDGRTNP